MKFIKKEIIFSLVTILFVVLILEGVLALFSATCPKVRKVISSPWIAVSSSYHDKRLEHRPNPEYPGHDRKGFRNPYVPYSVEIIALGDSQTYGTNVESQEAWPRQVESISGKKVYNMAFGGYGPVHSLILWDEAMAFHPKVIIEALYAGNDLYDSFNLVYNVGSLPELKTSDPVLQDKIESLEKVESITEKVRRTYRLMYPKSNSKLIQESEEGSLFKNFKLYGLMRRAVYELRHMKRSVVQQKSESTKWEEAKEFPEEIAQYFEVFEDGQFKTIFTPESRLDAVDLEDSRIQEGYQISMKAIERMHQLASKSGIRFLVVLIPTKEFVFRNYVKEKSEDFLSLITHEESFWSRTVDLFRQYNIEYVDAMPALEEQLAKGNQPYQITKDGHPNALGHRAIAEVVNTQLQISH